MLLVNKSAKRHSRGNMLILKIQKWDTSEKTKSKHSYKHITAVFSKNSNFVSNQKNYGNNINGKYFKYFDQYFIN